MGMEVATVVGMGLDTAMEEGTGPDTVMEGMDPVMGTIPVMALDTDPVTVGDMVLITDMAAMVLDMEM